MGEMVIIEGKLRKYYFYFSVLLLLSLIWSQDVSPATQLTPIRVELNYSRMKSWWSTVNGLYEDPFLNVQPTID